MLSKIVKNYIVNENLLEIDCCTNIVIFLGSCFINLSNLKFLYLFYFSVFYIVFETLSLLCFAKCTKTSQ